MARWKSAESFSVRWDENSACIFLFVCFVPWVFIYFCFLRQANQEMTQVHLFVMGDFPTLCGLNVKLLRNLESNKRFGHFGDAHLE